MVSLGHLSVCPEPQNGTSHLLSQVCVLAQYPCVLSVSIPDSSWHMVTQYVSSDICVDENFAMGSKDEMDV